MPRIREEVLSRRVRGVEKSGTVSTSGMKRRVPRKSKKLAKPKKRRRRRPCVYSVSVRCFFFFCITGGGGVRVTAPNPLGGEKLTSEREYQVGRKDETVRQAGIGVAREARY